MAVESAEDLAGFFDPDEFGEPMVATIGIERLPFNGIYTDGPITEQPGTTPGITGYVPRVIAQRAPLVDLKQGDRIERESGAEFTVNDLQIKNDLLIIFLHDNW